jgi:hypothetical protein
MTNERRTIPTKALVAAAVLGLLAGATGCGSAQRTAATRPAPSQSVAPTGDKSACGNHPGSSCAAVDTTPPPK